MNKFVLLACIGILSVNLVAARPDLSHGYRYNAGHSSGGGGFLNAPAPVTSFAPTASGNSYFNSAPPFGAFTSGGFGGSVGGGTSGSFSIGGGEQTSSSYDTQSFYNQAPIVTKHFYLHTAPVDHDEQQIVRYINVGRPQKNYRVVFINAPSSTVSKAKIIANVAPVEDKTAIYVLSKKSNALDVSAEVVTPAPVNHKPEVFYIKYKTPEEAVHAQHTIQAQYDALGGSSDLVNEGTIPVSSVIGSLGGGDAGHVVGDGSQNFGPAIAITHTGDNTQATYLPVNQK